MVETAYGKITGVDMGDYVEYRGIPYAKPPVGNLRWRAPKKPENFDGVYRAADFRNKCIQREGSSPPWDRDFYDDPSYDRPMSEDCLYLHIWAPKDGRDCPVAFWIKEFDGAAYCRRGVIFVSVEYRCNVFGYLAHPWLTAEEGLSGNYGSLDQIAALDWVYENIAGFGGDPENITVFGQSAQTLVSSPLTGDRIAKAILQSGGSYGAGLHRDIPLSEQEEYGLLFSEVLQAHSLEEMRARPAREVFAAMEPFFEKAMPRAKGLFLAPTLDGHLLTGGFYDLIDQGKIRDIPYLLGSTKDDIMVPHPRPAGGQPGRLALCRAMVHVRDSGALLAALDGGRLFPQRKDAGLLDEFHEDRKPQRGLPSSVESLREKGFFCHGAEYLSHRSIFFYRNIDLTTPWGKCACAPGRREADGFGASS